MSKRRRKNKKQFYDLGPELRPAMNWDWVAPGEIGIGSMPQTAADYATLQRAGFGAVLDLTEPFEGGCRNAGGLSRRNIPCRDRDAFAGLPLPERDLMAAVAWIAKNVDVGKPVLIHCREGRNRSAVVTVAYLCIKRHLRLFEAIHRVVAARPAVSPNCRQTAALCRAIEGEASRRDAALLDAYYRTGLSDLDLPGPAAGRVTGPLRGADGPRTYVRPSG